MVQTEQQQKARQPVKINIGGEKLITVNPDLFDVAGANKLSAISSGCWAPLDADGHIFVDYCPGVFLPLVEWLREVRDAEVGQEVFVRVEDRNRSAWIRMMGALSFAPHLLRSAGIRAQELAGMGYSAHHLYTVAGFSGKDLVRAGIVAAEIRNVLQADEIRLALSQIVGSEGQGYWVAETLARAGFTKSELTAAGFEEDRPASLFGKDPLYPLFGSGSAPLTTAQLSTFATAPSHSPFESGPLLGGAPFGSNNPSDEL